jgi:hypothetical protein
MRPVFFQIGRSYTRDQIHDELGGSKQEYLPMKDGQVLYGAFRRDSNPEAPDVVLPGLGRKIVQSAVAFAKQREPIPVFIKRAVNAWEYVGNFRVKSVSHEPAVVERYARQAERDDDVSIVLFLEQEKGSER